MTLEELRARYPSLAADRRLLRNDVYQVLLVGILTGDLAPGERLKDGELTEALRVSRTPVREAISKLQQVGLIRTAPNRYTLVAPMEIKEILNVIGVMRLLFPTAIGEALHVVDVDMELELTVLAERLEREAEAPVVDAFQRATTVVLDAIPDRVLAESIEMLIPRFVRYVSLSPEGAEALSRQHVLDFARAMAHSEERAVDLMDAALQGLVDDLRPRVGGAG
ncbi:GntR family transcriptional regulator [Leifsonia shinshuensis]|uniref:DNA-binding GntR family transcriptional regulator n=1 Tax=Leifsonia shinshuensis TaxID=150026 RepID=A0A853CS02_9MICO|nr:GntR family transcriptional regulator [Leifsonia shinshuensis]NYJ22004.1 DNA-binding GntR family transcriptional regulator [Leifsonia shinshuensis]